MQKKKKFQLKYSSIYLPILHTCGYHYLLIFETAHQFIHGGKEQRRGGERITKVRHSTNVVHSIRVNQPTQTT